jgi:hypothetical protein
VVVGFELGDADCDVAPHAVATIAAVTIASHTLDLLLG